MGDIDRISKITPGRFLSDSDHLVRVARKAEDQEPPKQHKEEPSEHPDQVEIHLQNIDESSNVPETPPNPPKKRPQSQQNHLDISA